MRIVIQNILRLSNATNWEFQCINGIDEELTVWGLDQEEIDLLQEIVTTVIPGCFHVSVIDGSEESKEFSESNIRHTPEEFAEKYKDPFFKLASDIERDMFAATGIPIYLLSGASNLLPAGSNEISNQSQPKKSVYTGIGIELDRGWEEYHLEMLRESKTQETVQTCDHLSKHYVSFSGHEEFDYCEKCEQKL